MVFKGIRAVISFLTIIPTGNYDIRNAASSMFLFPLAGLLIGTICASAAFLLGSVSIDGLLGGFIITCIFLIVSGFHHTDALADFSDGLMAGGSVEKKRKAMMDPAIGTAGAVSLVLYVIGMIISLSGFESSIRLALSCIAAEVTAKYVMVIIAHLGRPAWEGFSTPFAAAMKNKRKLIIASTIALPIVFLAGGFDIVVSIPLALSIGGGMALFYLSKKSIGGISGDVMGASNEITRLLSLLALAVIF